MTREIEFSAWIKDEKRMIVVEEINFIYKEVRFKDYNTPFTKPIERNVSFEDIELMQYTGLKDKKRLKIYEDDIVATTFNNFKYKVIWDSESSSYGLQNITFNWDILELTSHKTHAIEIIGNIYENPELLGGKR